LLGGYWPATDDRSLLSVQMKIISALRGVPVTSGVSVVESAPSFNSIHIQYKSDTRSWLMIEIPEAGYWAATDDRSLLLVQVKIISALRGVPVTSGVSVDEDTASFTSIHIQHR
jgi:hypothetical protein